MKKVKVRIHFGHYVNAPADGPQHAIRVTDQLSGLTLIEVPMSNEEAGMFLSNSDFELSFPTEFNDSGNVGKKYEHADLHVPGVTFEDFANDTTKRALRARVAAHAEENGFHFADGWRPRSYDFNSYNNHMMEGTKHRTYRFILGRFVDVEGTS